jgi:hypothetical protein
MRAGSDEDQPVIEQESEYSEDSVYDADLDADSVGRRVTYGRCFLSATPLAIGEDTK